MAVIRVPKTPGVEVERWVSFLKRQLKIRYLSAFTSEDRLVKTAARIALFGGTGDPRATEVYQALVPLLFHTDRIKSWEKALDKLPATKDGLLTITRAVQAANTLEPIEKARFDPVTFIDIACKLPDPKGYVEVCRREQHKLLRTAFHPNTYEYLKQRYRGVVGDLADPGYADQVALKVKTVS